VKWLQPSFGGINLEDISSPKCFYILDTLRKEIDIPVWHDDQQGTAVVTLAGLVNALKIVGKKKEKVSLAIIGAGAANIAIARILFANGFKPENTIFVDSKAILHTGRTDIEEKQALANSARAVQELAKIMGVG
jgi:malate dehydrogenase (oxaloacetate-decarboxylating)